MKYFFTDFEVLSALSDRGTLHAEAILEAVALSLNYPVELPALASALAVLAADGYVTVEDTVLHAHTRATLTEKGRSALAISWFSKLFKKAKNLAVQRNLKAFCALPRPVQSPMETDAASFEAALARLREYRDMRLYRIEDEEEGLYTLTFTRPFVDEGDCDDPDAPVTDGCVLTMDEAASRKTMHDLLDTAIFMKGSNRPRKVGLYGSGRAYVMTVAYVADENGETVLRLSVAPILFNRQRFAGKRDSDLDYAQCGDNVLTTALYSVEELIGLLLAGALMRPDLLDEEQGGKINDLCEAL